MSFTNSSIADAVKSRHRLGSSAPYATASASAEALHPNITVRPTVSVTVPTPVLGISANPDDESKVVPSAVDHFAAPEVEDSVPTPPANHAAPVCDSTRFQLASCFKACPEAFAFRSPDGSFVQPTNVLEIMCPHCHRAFEAHPFGMPTLVQPRADAPVDVSPRVQPVRAVSIADVSAHEPLFRVHSGASSLASAATRFDEAQSKMLEKMVKFTSKVKAFDPSVERNCQPFLESIRLALYSSGVDSIHWYRILPRLVVGEHVERWVQEKLVEASPPPSSWQEACEVFTAHYQRVDHKAVLANEYSNIKQTTTVQDFADRFRNLVSRLKKDIKDDQVCRDFLNRVKPHIENGFKQLTGQFKLLSGQEFVPRDLDHVIEICLDVEQSHQKSITNVHVIDEQRKRGEKPGPVVSSKTTDKVSKEKTPAGAKYCDKHGSGNHSTKECRTLHIKDKPNPEKVSSAPTAKPVAKPVPPPTSDKVTCYTCRQVGHKSPDCPLRPKSAPRVNAVTFGSSTEEPLAERDVFDAFGEFKTGDDLARDAEESVMPQVSALSPGGDEVANASRRSVYGSAKLVLLYKGREYRVNCDSGADVSVMHMERAHQDAIAYSPREGGFLQGADASMVVNRIGRTSLLNMIAHYRSDDPALRFAPRTVKVQFEIMRFDENRKYDIIIGKDVLHLLFPTGLPLAYMLQPVRLADAVPAQILSLTADSDPLLSVEGTSALSTNEALEREYQPFREKLMKSPALVEVLEINGRLTGFCNRPDACLKLRLKPRDQWPAKVNLCKPNYKNINERNIADVDSAIQKWQEQGKIVPAPPGCAYNHPLVPAPKYDKDGNIKGWRTCLDFRGLNLVLENTDSFQLPRIRESLESLSGCTIFGEFDLSDAYLQFPLHEESRPLTAFTWKGQQWMFTGCPFGIAVLPQHFQRVMSQVLEGLPLTFPYIDNIPLGSTTWDEHERMAVEIVRRLNAANLQLKPSSVNLGYPVLRVLGHQISAQGVGVDPAKGETVRNWPIPRTGKDLEKFLGFANFLQQYVRHFADLAGPLHALKAHKIIQWSPADLECFETLKRAIANSPWLKHPDFTRQFCIATDASDTGIGGVLYQPDSPDGPVTPQNIVSIFSEKLNDAQRRYSAFKKELYGLVRALVRFERYVKFRDDLIIWTDHKPLRAIVNSSPTDSKAVADRAVQGWLDTILEFKFRVEYRPGATNLLPDALSRAYSMAYPKQWGVPDPQNPRPDYRAMIGDRIILPTVAPITRAKARETNSSSSKGEEAADETPADTPTQLAVELERRGKTCPPADERLPIVHKAHLWGHFGREAIYAELYRRGFWWPNMRGDIDSVTANCEPCMRFNITKRGFDPAQYILATKPWDHVQIDTSVHLPPSVEGGFTVLLVIIDVFSGFVILRACKSTDADEIARHLWDVFCTFGVPKILQSDNGPEFVNLILNTLVRIVGIDRRLITPYNPRADGKVERAVGSVTNILKKCLNGAAHHWPMFIPFAMLAFNSKVAELTGSTPFSLMFARNPNELRDYTVDPPQLVEVDFNAERPLWLDFIHKVQAIIHPSIVQRMRGQKEEMVKRLDAHRKALIPKPISKDTEVWLADRRLIRSKHEPNYLGPYWVVEAHRNGVYTLRDADNRPLPTAVTRDMLKVRRAKQGSVSSNGEFEFVDPDQVPRSERYQQTNWEVERILGHRETTLKPEIGGYDYKVRWVGFDETSDSWVHDSDINANTLVREYWASHTKSVSKPRGRPRRTK